MRRVVGNNILKLRIAAGLSQEQLEGLTGLDKSHIGKIERGKHNASLETLRIICFEFDTTPYELFREDHAEDPFRTVNRYIKRNMLFYVDGLTVYDPFLLAGLFACDALKRLTVDDIARGAKHKR